MPILVPVHSAVLNFRVHTPLGHPGDHKGKDLGDRHGKPNAGQLQHGRQNQEHQQRTDRLGIHQKVRKFVLFRCVKVGCCNADKRQTQQRCQEERQVLNDPGICLLGRTEQRADLCSGEIDASHADGRDHDGGQIGQLSGGSDATVVTLSVVLADQRLTAVAYPLQQQIEDRGNIADAAVNRHRLLIPV